MVAVTAKTILGDCREALRGLRDNSVDLIFTSPPYADQRSQTYGGIKPDQYVDWFTPIATELFRVLKPDGTFVLNIKEKAQNGERHTYVLELILAMRKLGWFWSLFSAQLPIGTMTSSWYILKCLDLLNCNSRSHESLKRLGHFPG